MSTTATAIPPSETKPTLRVQAVSEHAATEIPYEEFIARYVRANKPVVIRGAANAWPAMQRWTPDYFRKRFPEVPVQVSYDSQIPFARFVDEVEASTVEKPGPYMYRLFLHEDLPDVLEDVMPQNAFAFPRRHCSPLMPEYWRRPDGYLKLLFGGVGGGFPVLHYDTENAHATITEIYGDKEFILFPPGDGAFLYPKPDRPNHSQIKDPTSPDLARFPLAARATCFRTVLKPGDMVFVPCGWWHTARVLTTSISVGMNILDRSNWNGFVSEVCPPRGRLRPKGLLKELYFRGAGWLLNVLEDLQKVAPRLASALVFPSRIAPIRAADVPDPSKSRLNIRLRTR